MASLSDCPALFGFFSPRGRRVLLWGGLLLTVVATWLAGLGIGIWVFGGSSVGASGVFGERKLMAILPQLEVTLPPGATETYRQMLEIGRRIVRMALVSFPDHPEALAAAARLHDLAHDTEREVACWRRCLEIDARYLPAYLRLATLSLQAGRYEEVVELTRRALRFHPQSPDCQTMLAEALLNLGRMTEAEEVLRQHLQEYPQSVAGRFLLGNLFVRQKRFEEAIPELETVVRLAPSHANAYHNLATACARLGRVKEAETYRREFAKLKEAEQTAQRQGLQQFVDEKLAPSIVAQIAATTGRLFLQAGNAGMAEVLFRQAAALDPANVEARLLLSDLLHERGELREALRIVMELRALEPLEPRHHRNAGLLFAKLGRLDWAEAAFRDFSMIAPGSAIGPAAIAELYLVMGRDLPEARRLAEKAVILEPSVNGYRLLAEVCRRLGDQQGASQAEEKARQLGMTKAP